MIRVKKNIFPPLSLPLPMSQWPMLKTFSVVFIMLFFISCASREPKAQVERMTEDNSPRRPAGTPLEELAAIHHKNLRFQISTTLLNFNRDQEEKLIQATELIKKVVVSKEFREGVLNHSWQGKKQFVNNQGLSNAQIYAKILEASESYNTEKNNSLDVELELYHETNRTIGYTFPNSRRIWMNKKYFDKYSPIQVSDNLFHEWLHKLGFDHDATWSTDRDHSVPYALGYLVERIAAQL